MSQRAFISHHRTIAGMSEVFWFLHNMMKNPPLTSVHSYKGPTLPSTARPSPIIDRTEWCVSHTMLLAGCDFGCRQTSTRRCAKTAQRTSGRKSWQ